MKLTQLIHDLLTLLGAQEISYRLIDYNTGLRRRRRNTQIRLRYVTFSLIAWIPIIAWVGAAFYRSTVRKDKLVARREEREQADAERKAATIGSPTAT